MDKWACVCKINKFVFEVFFPNDFCTIIIVVLLWQNNQHINKFGKELLLLFGWFDVVVAVAVLNIQ